MKPVVPILMFILILILRQASPELMIDQKLGSSLILQEVNLISGAQGLGCLSYMDQGDPDEMPPACRVFQNEAHLLIGASVLSQFRYPFHCHTNPLLIDRPPPNIGA